MNAKQKSRWWVDALLFGGFILAFLLDLTGLELHQWLGIGVGVLALYHLVEHSDWVAAVTARFFGKTSGRSRLYLVIDALLGAGFAGIILTGLVISTWFNLTLTSSAAWLAVHIVISILTLLLTAVKIALHGRWVGVVTRSVFSRDHTATLPRAAGAALAVPGRREFVRAMSVVGLGTLVALSQSMQGLFSLSSGDSPSTGSATSTSTSTNSGAAASSSSTTSTSCQLRCGRRCSYPGHCRRYTDSNKNGKCDLGECAS